VAPDLTADEARWHKHVKPEERVRDTVDLVERVRARLAALRRIEHEPEE
jgi:hypothetical protein